MTANPDSLETLTTVANEAEAAPIVGALAAEGIRAMTTGGFTAGFIAEAPGDIQIIVSQKDLEQAKTVLAEIQMDASEVDWSQVDVGEPEDP